MNEYRLGIIGAGRVFQEFHLPAIKRSRCWSLECLADLDPVRRRWAQGEFPGNQIFSEPTELLRREELDAVLIASPPDTHFSLTSMALERDLHVLLEKPGGLSEAQAKTMSQFAVQSGRLLRIAFNRRLMPAYRELRRMIVNKGTENVSTVSGKLVFSIKDWSASSGYLGDPGRGGGVVHDVASHWVDLVPWLFKDQIEQIKVEEHQIRSAGEESLRFRLCLHSGLEAVLTVAHGAAYAEQLQVIFDSGTRYQLYPMGVIGLPGSMAGKAIQIAKMRYWLERKLTRLGFRQDPISAAADRLWEAFSLGLSGQTGEEELVDGAQLVTIHNALEQLARSQAVDGYEQLLASSHLQVTAR